MNTLNLLLRDKNNKVVSIKTLSLILEISPERIYNCINSGKGWSLEKSYWLSKICEAKGYSFPVEMFLDNKYIRLINQIWGLNIERYNPVS